MEKDARFFMGAERPSAASITSLSQTKQSPALSTGNLPSDTKVFKSLIAAVKCRPILWQHSNKNKKCCDFTHLWEKVSLEVDLPVDICRIRWGYLRENFRRKYNAKNTKWRLYEDLRFLEMVEGEKPLGQDCIIRKSLSRYTRGIQKKCDQNNEDNNSNGSLPICDTSGNGNRELQQPGFTTGSTFFDNIRHSPPLKRIKYEENVLDYEPSDTEELNHSVFNVDAITSGSDAKSSSENAQLNTLFSGISNIFLHKALEDDNKEQKNSFELAHIKTEDVLSSPSSKDATANITAYNATNDESCNTKQKKGNELVDIKTEDSILLPGSEDGIVNQLTFSNTTGDSRSNNKTCTVEAQQDDADRMFMLSLLPYMQRLDKNRKLCLRQKLQNILNEEFS